jgi:A/G-specific adenine glycosylase
VLDTNLPPQTEVANFKQMVWDYYKHHGRLMPWRVIDSEGFIDPYRILVSEIMLQQTQVERVRSKYLLFLKKFPDFRTLASATLGEVFMVWSGLGYNRRAKYLHDFAVDYYDKQFPQTIEELVSHKGIGANTAAAVLVYSFNHPLGFIETNIRTTYLHHFFSGNFFVTDKDIIRLVEMTLDCDNPREWYWALMDYGTYLKRSGIKTLYQSRHYSRQSLFEGSTRQLRGKVMRLLSDAPRTPNQLVELLPDERLERVIDSLLQEKLVKKTKGLLNIG